jgi:hypothetical protein
MEITAEQGRAGGLPPRLLEENLLRMISGVRVISE